MSASKIRAGMRIKTHGGHIGLVLRVDGIRYAVQWESDGWKSWVYREEIKSVSRK